MYCVKHALLAVHFGGSDFGPDSFTLSLPGQLGYELGSGLGFTVLLVVWAKASICQLEAHLSWVMGYVGLSD